MSKRQHDRVSRFALRIVALALVLSCATPLGARAVAWVDASHGGRGAVAACEREAAWGSAQVQEIEPAAGGLGEVQARARIQLAAGALGGVWEDLVGWLSGSQGSDDDTVEPDTGLLKSWADGQVQVVLGIGEDTYYQALETYARGRVVAVDCTSREPEVFGPWSAEKDLNADAAASSGAITEWQEFYYVTHDWSTYGMSILSFVPGDRVEINGRAVEVLGVFDYPKDAYSDEIWMIVGFDAVVFQTCEPDSDLNRIAYGRWVEA